MIETFDDIEKIVHDSVKSKSGSNSGLNKILSSEVKQLDQKYQNFRINIAKTIILNEIVLRA